MIAFNLNDTILVKLNDSGKKIYRDHWHHIIKDRDPIVDENGYTSFQMWDFMHIYGPFLMLGCTPPFEDMNILLKK